MTNHGLPPAPAPRSDTADHRRPRRRRAVVIAAAAAALLITAPVAYSLMNQDTPVVDTEAAGVSIGTVTGLGDVLVDSEGRTLYLFEPDEGTDVTCTGGCAAKWPPLTADGDTSPQLGAGVDEATVGTVLDQEGTSVVTFDGWPLYRYTADMSGEASGNGKDQNGGVWWALSPSGERIQP